MLSIPKEEWNKYKKLSDKYAPEISAIIKKLKNQNKRQYALTLEGFRGGGFHRNFRNIAITQYNALRIWS